MNVDNQVRFDLLDHGYLGLVETWGSEERIIEAARMSTGKGFLGWDQRECDCSGTSMADGVIALDWDPKCQLCDGTGKLKGDAKLLSYLWKNNHATPFEMAGLTIEVQAPIFVFREWHRHRVPFGYNELSARYTPMPDVNYVPTLERLVMGRDPTKNKQAGTIKGAAFLTDEAAVEWLTDLEAHYVAAEKLYQKGLNIGVPKELARLPVPVGRYSRMMATGNLRGWLAFLRLREASGAQWEIRQFAHKVATCVQLAFPRTYELFEESRRAS